MATARSNDGAVTIASAFPTARGSRSSSPSLSTWHASWTKASRLISVHAPGRSN